MATDITTLAIECKTNDAINNVESFTKSMESARGTAKSLLGTLAGLFASNALRQFKQESVAAFSDMEEARNRFSVTFENTIDKANASMETLRSEFGLSRSAAYGMLASTGDLLTGFGMTSESALDLSEKAARLGMDLYSYTNYAGGATGATQAITAAMLGETERMKGLGVVIRQDSDSFKKMVKEQMQTKGVTESVAKAFAVYTEIVNQSKNAIGDWNRPGETFAQVLQAQGQLLNEFKTNVGETLQTPVKAFMKNINSLLEGFNNLDKSTQKFIVTVGGALAVWGSIRVAVSAFNIAQGLSNVLTGQSAAAKTAETAETAKQTVATETYNAVLAKQIALLHARSASVGKTPVANNPAPFALENTRQDLAYTQTRFGQHQANRAANINSKIWDQYYYSAASGKNMSSTSLRIMQSGGKGIVDKGVVSLRDNIKNLNSTAANTAKNIGQRLVPQFAYINPAVASAGKQAVATGGKLALLGKAAGALGSIARVATGPIGMIGGTLIALVAQYKDEIANWTVDLFTGGKASEYDKMMADQEKAANEKKQKQIEEQQKKEELTREQLKRQELMEELQRKESDIYYSEMTVETKFLRDRMRLTELSGKYVDVMKKQKPDLEKANKLADEISEIYKRIPENEKRLKRSREELRSIYLDYLSNNGNIDAAQVLNTRAIEDTEKQFEEAKRKNLQGRNPEEYNSLLRKYIGSLNTRRQLEKRTRDNERWLLGYQLDASKTVAEKAKLLQDAFDKSQQQMEIFAANGQVDAFKEAADRSKSLAQQLDDLRKGASAHLGGVITSSASLQYGTMEAYREQRRIYEKDGSGDRDSKQLTRKANQKVLDLMPQMSKNLAKVAEKLSKTTETSSMPIELY